MELICFLVIVTPAVYPRGGTLGIVSPAVYLRGHVRIAYALLPPRNRMIAVAY